MRNRTRRRWWRVLAPLHRKSSRTGAARSLLTVALVGLLTTACDVHSPTGPGSLTNIVVTPDVTLAIFGTQQFTAVGTDHDGNVVTFVPQWSVVASGGTINGSGMFTAGTDLGVFTATVKASDGTHSGTATVTVVAGPLETLEVTPNAVTLQIDQLQQFTAVGRDAGGNVVPVSPTWDMVNDGGTIDQSSGLFTAGAVLGTFESTVEASSGSKTGTATVAVVAGPLTSIQVTPNPVTLGIGDDQQFTAVGRDAGGNVVPISPTWDVVNSGGSIDANSGMFTAGAVLGTFGNTVEARSGDMMGTATVTVEAVTPPPPPPPPPPPSPLNSAADFGILAGAGIDCAISGSVTGASTAADIGSSPTLTINGFGPCTFDGSIPLPAVVATAKGDLTAAYLAAQGEVCDLDLSGVDLGFYNAANPLPPGTYCFSTSVGLTGTLQLNGSASDTWTFQIGSTLTAAVGSQVILGGGAIPDNVYWAVGSSATLNTNSAFQGNIMSQASITLQADVSLLGRALAQTGAVDLISGGVSIVKP